MNWLGKNLELVALRPSFFQQISCGSLTRKQQNFAAWALGPSRDGGFNARHSSHNDVRDEHIWRERIQRLDGLFAAVDRSSFKTGLVQDDGESVRNDLFVVGDENARLGRCGRCYI